MASIIARNRPTLLVSERTGGTNMGIWASSASFERVSVEDRGEPRRVRVAFSTGWRSHPSNCRRFNLREGDSERRPLAVERVQDLYPKQLTRLR